MISLDLILLLIMVLVPILLILLFLWSKRDEIFSYLHPENWAIVEMLEMDNNVVSWLQKKTDSLTFEFREGIYNMFEVKSYDTPDMIKDNSQDMHAPENVPALIGVMGNKTPIEQKVVQPGKDERKLPSEYKVFTSVYREGRLPKFYYKEGNRNPLDFRTGQITGDAQISKQIDRIQMGELINSAGSLGQELFEKYGFWVLLAIGVILLIIIFKK